MNEYANSVKKTLEDTLSEMQNCMHLFVTNPGKDFSRNRKLDFKETLRMLLSIGGGSLRLEILKYFSYSTDAVTSSAFVQQRGKIRPEALQYIFHKFTTAATQPKYYHEYRMLAVDGSDLCISAYRHDTDNYFQTSNGGRGFGMLHLNAMYDLCSRIYVDAIVQAGRSEDEYQALIDMVERSDIDGNVILTADRGYENYNLFEHIQQKGWKFAIRVKDKKSTGILSGLDIPDSNTFDREYSLLMTRRHTNKVRSNRKLYKFVSAKQRFDYLPHGSKDDYPVRFRIVRFPISENTFEVIITNLSAEEFPIERIKEIYHMRWGIETSFRDLKYSIGMTSFHAKKVAYIIQEIYAKLTMYNFCEIITTHVVIEQKDRKHVYQVNFTLAIKLCLQFYRCRNDIAPPNVEALIQKNILPVRTDRKDPRKVRAQSTVSFLYRVA